MQAVPIKQIFFQTIDSTQQYSKNNTGLIEKDLWLAVRANEQTKGRGMGLNQWKSPVGKNIYVTFSFRWDLDKMHLINFLPQIATLSVFQTIMDYKESKNQNIKLKWINDIIINNKKVCGVLCETEQEEQLIVFIGIGVNIDMLQPEFGSIEQELSITINQQEFYDQLCLKLYANIKILEETGFKTFQQIIQDNLYKLNEQVTLMDYDEKNIISQGQLVGINQYGNILLRGNLGLIETHASGRLKW